MAAKIVKKDGPFFERYFFFLDQALRTLMSNPFVGLGNWLIFLLFWMPGLYAETHPELKVHLLLLIAAISLIVFFILLRYYELIPATDAKKIKGTFEGPLEEAFLMTLILLLIVYGFIQVGIVVANAWLATGALLEFWQNKDEAVQLLGVIVILEVLYQIGKRFPDSTKHSYVGKFGFRRNAFPNWSKLR